MSKDSLLKKCTETLKQKKVSQWYNENLEGKPQVDTLDSLGKGFLSGKLSLIEALTLAFIVGFQWSIKFEGVE